MAPSRRLTEMRDYFVVLKCRDGTWHEQRMCEVSLSSLISVLLPGAVIEVRAMDAEHERRVEQRRTMQRRIRTLGCRGGQRWNFDRRMPKFDRRRPRGDEDE